MSAVYVKGQKTSLRRTIMGSKKVLSGFDYRLQKQVERSRSEWREELKKVVSAGGRRRHEHGETYGHGPKGLIAFEIYDNVCL
jgi:hypothetical protein